MTWLTGEWWHFWLRGEFFSFGDWIGQTGSSNTKQVVRGPMFVYIHPTFLKIPMFDEPIVQPPRIWSYPTFWRNRPHTGTPFKSTYEIKSPSWFHVLFFRVWCMLFGVFVGFCPTEAPDFCWNSSCRWWLASTQKPVISGVVVWSCTGKKGGWIQKGKWTVLGGVLNSNIFVFSPRNTGEMIRWVSSTTN